MYADFVDIISTLLEITTYVASIAELGRMRDLLSVMKALADENRLRIVSTLEGQELCLCQLVELLGLATSTVSRHASILQQARLVESRKQGRWTYFRLAETPPPAALEALSLVVSALKRDHRLGKIATSEAYSTNRPRRTLSKAERVQMLKILFLCTGNSCRSQMAEGWARHLKCDVLEPYSAGIETHGLNPNAVKVMAEAGVDISSQASSIWTT